MNEKLAELIKGNPKVDEERLRQVLEEQSKLKLGKTSMIDFHLGLPYATARPRPLVKSDTFDND